MTLTNMREDLPLVSIITPSFNQAPFLEATIESVLAQDYPNIEYLIMDGGSTDGSVEIIRKHEDHLACWTSERDNGQTSAIRKGFDRATGSIFAWLNSDDLLAPSAVRIVVDLLRRLPDVGVVYGDRLHIDAKGNVIGINRMPAFYPAMFARNITLPQETVFFRRGVYELVGGLDETLRFSLDFDLWVRMSAVTNFRHVPAFLGSFREHTTSKSVAFHSEGNRDGDRYLEEHARVLRWHFGRPLPTPAQTKWNRLRHKARLLIEQMSQSRRDQVARIRGLIEQKELVATKWV
jgi:glycosyltransferase involved in cell wall biosynthesis